MKRRDYEHPNRPPRRDREAVHRALGWGMLVVAIVVMTAVFYCAVRSIALLVWPS